MPPVNLKLSTPGVWDFSYTTELAQLICILTRKVNYLKNLWYKTLNFRWEIRIKDIHRREDKIPAQCLPTTTLGACFFIMPSFILLAIFDVPLNSERLCKSKYDCCDVT